MKRPNIEKIHNGEDLKKWYWLKQELVEYCKIKQLSYVGEKFAILERIAFFLDSKKSIKKKIFHKVRKYPDLENPKNKEISKSIKLNSLMPISKFDWSKSDLTLSTIITDSYKNGENTRKFFKRYCGDKFHFTIPFMRFMKQNIGKTLQDAIKEWQRLDRLSKQKNFKSEIPSGNQYNQYIRDFFIANPTKSLKEARHFWKLKRSLPLGKHVYENSDLQLK